jgi:hypothetical protein
LNVTFTSQLRLKSRNALLSYFLSFPYFRNLCAGRF